ncbi:MAG: methionine adenosyltransferase [Burkholderiales bacterium]|nr:MAG: methionine adenosyltransferase [Burkholderiales bacterium]
MAHEQIFTSESVTPGHPDKLCDQISDAVIDAFLRQDPRARAMVECAVATGVLFVSARFAADATVDIPGLAREVVGNAGYLDAGFDARSCSILTSFTELPAAERLPASARRAESEPALEQANAFGFACSETPALMPLPIWLAHRLARALYEARPELEALGADGKTQVAVTYRGGRPHRIHSIALSAALREPGAEKRLVQLVHDRVIPRAFDGEGVAPDARTETHVNSGAFYMVGGPARHSGLTGRKTGIDTYGEYARQSGAALSGKDPSRIDRIGAYAARHAARNVVAAGLATRCEVHLAYAIGSAQPLSVAVNTFGTGVEDDDAITRRLEHAIDFRPGMIEQRFELRARAAASAHGFFRPLAVYGQVGRTDLDLPWEQDDLVPVLRR